MPVEPRGDELWTYAPTTDPGLFPSNGVYVDGRIEIAWSFASLGGRVGIDATTGEELFNEGGPGRSGTHTLAVADGEVAAGTSAMNPFLPGVLLSQVSWRCGIAYTGSPTGPRGGRTFAFTGDGDALAWSFGTEARGFRNCDESIGGWTASWATELGGTPTGVAAVGADAAAYVDDTGTLSLLDATTGGIRWTTEVGVDATRPAVADGKILVSTPDGRLVAYAADTGAQLWEAALGAPGGRPAVGGDVVHVAVGNDIVAFALDGCGAATCPSLASLAVGDPASDGPIIHDGRVVVGTADGRVVAFGLPAP